MSAATITGDAYEAAHHAPRPEIPAVGLVNERKLYKFGEVDERIKALRMWAGLWLRAGNHTTAISSLNQAGLQAWKDDVVQARASQSRRSPK